jgi:phage tail sheath protein FI
MRPGTTVISRDQPLPRSAPVETSVWFAVGETETGPEQPVLVRSLQSYEDTFGSRAGGATLHDALDTYFREGGNRAYISAVPTTVTPLMRVVDRGDTEAAAAEAAAGHEQANPRSRKKQTDTKQGDTPTQQLLVPADAATALDRFGADLGPGQVSIPGQTDTTLHTALLQHAAERNRVALLDGPETGTAAAYTTLATGLHTDANARYGALFCPWAVIPGLAPGTTRVVPYSAVQAGLCARGDILNPWQAAAGDRGLSSFATDLTGRFLDSEYEQLNEAGANMARVIYGGVETYGYRSLADPATTIGLNWIAFTWARLNMAIVARAHVVGDRYVFAQLDGRRRKIAQFGSELRAMLIPFYEAGALYGATADEAFQVDVGDQVNTEETIANGELHAHLKVRMSGMAEAVIIEIVKVAPAEALAA